MPQIASLFVKPQTAGTWQRRRLEIAAASGEREGEQP
jgi:hypothetical protein